MARYANFKCHFVQTNRRLMKLSRQIFIIISSLEKRYYRLSYYPRHIVGYTLLVSLVGIIALIGYGGYKGVTSGWHYLGGLFNSDDDIEYVDDDSNHKARKHYEFPVPTDKRHPKRVPNYSKDFSYINEVQLEAAMKLGIEPVENREELDEKQEELVKLHDNRYYSILPLTSSSPYLVPRAADFLSALGKLMQDYNGTDSRFYISSVLRTLSDVQRLAHINGNASSNSTHCYGTTVDITYSRFDVKGRTTEAKLKEDLARALYDLQAMGYCYVKYEYKQPCFHITVRP